MVRKRHPENVRSFLFYGPAGTGKSQVMRAIATETRAIIYDLSAYTVNDNYNTSKSDSEKMIAMVMMSAKKYQPAVIYIDECEKIFAGKKKKKKGQKQPKVKKNDPNNPGRIKKTLSTWKQKFVNDETRIVIIGCTNEP